MILERDFGFEGHALLGPVGELLSGEVLAEEDEVRGLIADCGFEGNELSSPISGTQGKTGLLLLL